VARLQAVRASRDASAVATALIALDRTARGDANLMPSILEAVRSMASVGEICGVLKGVFGKHRPRVNLA
jgi:methylmalonyl-CoA mutase N-terminal domain/subunit